MPLSAIIFDVDGTIAETEDAHRCAFNEAFAAFGLDCFWDEATYRRLLKHAGSMERMRHYFSTERRDRLARFEAVAEDMLADKTARYGKFVRQGRVRLRPGIGRLIADARAAGMRLAVATTTARRNVIVLLERLFGDEAPGWFAAMATGDRVRAKKPDPALYLMALGELALPAAECIAIEDSQIGIAAARAAGLAVVMTPGRYTMADSREGAIAVLDRLGDRGVPAHALAGPAPAGEMVTLDDLAHWLDISRFQISAS